MAIIVILLLLSGGILAQAISSSNSDGSPAWAKPTVMAIKLIGPAPNILEQPNFQSNLDCTHISYRVVNSSDMQSGCFMQTAYGLFDPDNEQIVFNSTDEALPFNVYMSHQVITPWPGSLDALSLAPALTGGSYLGLYRNLLAELNDNRNLLGQLTSKSVVAPPDFMIQNNDSGTMVINPQTMAFSSGGSWLVVENLSGAFVRINLATLDMTPFAPSFGTTGSPSLLKSQVAISKDGRYEAIENNSAKSFKLYDLNDCQDNGALPYMLCDSYDYWSYIESKINGLTSVRHLRFINSGLISFVADHNGISEVYELAPELEIRSQIDYLALGDSYTSGEGAFDYLLGTDTGQNSCHLSIHSYPLLIGRSLYGTGGHSVACSGAKIGDVLPLQTDTYKGQASDAVHALETQKTNILSNFTPGYVPQSDFVSQYQPGIVTLSIGGNDIGFSDILKSCVLPKISLHLSDGVCYNTFEDRVELKDLIDRTVPKWVTLIKQVSALSPSSKIYVLGYPQIFYDKGDCSLNVNLNKSELEFSAEVTSYIDGAIELAASESGANYIDVSETFLGYRLCETSSYSVAVNGLTAGKDAGVFGVKIFGNESYHPNAFGHSLLKSLILNQTNNFTVDLRSSVSANSSSTLLNAPVTGRSIRSLIPGNLGNEILNQFRGNNFSVDGISNGLLPNSSYSLSFDKGNVPLVSSVISDNQGNISGTYDIPENVTPGIHSLDIIGLNQVEEAVDIRQVVYIASNENDIDGDGVANSSDSCPTITNSGVDQDNDGIDDACDEYIGAISKPDAGSSIKSAMSSSTQAVASSILKTVTKPSAAAPISSNSSPMPQKLDIPVKKNDNLNSSNMTNSPVRDSSFRIWLGLTMKMSLRIGLILLITWLLGVGWRKITLIRQRYSLKGGTAITYS